MFDRTLGVQCTIFRGSAEVLRNALQVCHNLRKLYDGGLCQNKATPFPDRLPNQEQKSHLYAFLIVHSDLHFDVLFDIFGLTKIDFLVNFDQLCLFIFTYIFLSSVKRFFSKVKCATKVDYHYLNIALCICLSMF